MQQALLVLHFVGLVMGLGMGFAMAAIGAATRDMEPAAQAGLTQRLGGPIGRMSDAGFVLLLVTGVALLWTDGYAEAGALGLWFYLKMAGVVALAAFLGFKHMAAARARRGEQGAMQTAQKLGPLGLAIGVLTILFAVLAFA